MIGPGDDPKTPPTEVSQETVDIESYVCCAFLHACMYVCMCVSICMYVCMCAFGARWPSGLGILSS